MDPEQQHRCTLQRTADGAPFIAFEPSSGAASSYSNSLFTLDLRDGVTLAEADHLVDQINRLLKGVSSTVF